VIVPAQIKAARALLGLGQLQLSKLADLGITTVKRIELSEGPSGSVRTLLKLQSALERAGVEFIPADATKGPGVRLVQNERIGRTKTSRRAKRSG
jgi:transcriptional regulator with XRE-family HTH domain